MEREKKNVGTGLTSAASQVVVTGRERVGQILEVGAELGSARKLSGENFFSEMNTEEKLTDTSPCRYC